MYCQYCGRQIDNRSIICPYCGRNLTPLAAGQSFSDQRGGQEQYDQYGYEQGSYIPEQPQEPHRRRTDASSYERDFVYDDKRDRASFRAASKRDESLVVVVKVFLILGCIGVGWMIIPLAWCLPITFSIFKCFREGRPVNTGLKICTLLFVNIIAGIILLCMNDE